MTWKEEEALKLSFSSARLAHPSQTSLDRSTSGTQHISRVEVGARPGSSSLLFCPLLHPQAPLEDKSIFSGSLFHYLEENKKWRSRFLFVPDSYNINCYGSKSVCRQHTHAHTCQRR